MDTQWDRMPYADWLQHEIHRWHDKNYREAWVRQQPGGTGMVAMFTWKQATIKQ